MTGIKARVVHLYPRWVLFRGNGTLICTSPTCSFCSIVFAMIFIYYKDSKTPNITQLIVLAMQIQHMAAQKVGFTPRPIWHARALKLARFRLRCFYHSMLILNLASSAHIP